MSGISTWADREVQLACQRERMFHGRAAFALFWSADIHEEYGG